MAGGIAACGSSNDDCDSTRTCSSSGGIDAGGDAGSGATDGGSTGGSGGQSDSGTDTADAAPPASIVSVVNEIDQPVSGAKIVIHDVAGNPVETVDADSNGKATVQVESGGWVTAAKRTDLTINGSPESLFGLASARAPTVGNPIRLVVNTWSNIPTTPAPQTPMKLTINMQGVGASQYREVFMPCGGGTSGLGPTATIQAFAGCPGSTEFDVIVIGHDAQGYPAIYGQALAQAFVPGGTKTINVSVSANSFVSSNVTAKPIPAGTERIDLLLRASRPPGLDLLDVGLTKVPPAVEENQLLQVPAGLFSELQLWLRAQISTDTKQLLAQSFRRGAAVPSNVNWDPTQVALFDTTSGPDFSGDELLATVSWTTPAAKQMGDCVEYQQVWSDTAGPTHIWTVWIAPSPSDSFTMPTLPSELAEFLAPPATFVGWQIRNFDAILVSGYDEFLSQNNAALVQNADVAELSLY